MYILMDIDKMAEDLAMKEFEEHCVFNAYVFINGERRLSDFWQEIVNIKKDKHRERLIYLYGESKQESGADSSSNTGEGDGV